ncbi:TetR/AcrR family transcriptional regulator [Christiangramia sp. SM2212]|uniref:TetR/AcrR family transcriptional regulator n=1 Tax=Christiangramia sediminicola TaxID=3073267 RepID=A0ABU1ET44_9FLAO|nr:TetR/AcrR family transcriptional regulator [Christiangramia sp. SM2212]MDR5591565.1 TetR/AcrR family transcriptional regulator [Christiangramia sp. SM2212]
MREKILNTAADMFLTYGFKSVTMDDIAEALGISKKTIYAHYSTKNKLVVATSLHVVDRINCGIDEIREKGQNPIKENYEIKHFVVHHLKGEKTSPHYQLQKYYPKAYDSLKNKQFELLENCMIDNIQRGIEGGYYRKDIRVDFISRIHFIGMMGIKDTDLFPIEEYSHPKLMEYFLEYHLRAICTPKGVKILEELINNNEK